MFSVSIRILMILASLNSCTNPWIYTIFSSSVSKDIQAILCCVCKKRQRKNSLPEDSCFTGSTSLPKESLYWAQSERHTRRWRHCSADQSEVPKKKKDKEKICGNKWGNKGDKLRSAYQWFHHVTKISKIQKIRNKPLCIRTSFFLFRLFDQTAPYEVKESNKDVKCCRYL